MKEQDLKTLKEMANDLALSMPCGLMVDGNRNFYMEGKQESIVNIMMMIEEARTKAAALNDVIQRIEGRKQNSKPRIKP